MKLTKQRKELLVALYALAQEENEWIDAKMVKDYTRSHQNPVTIQRALREILTKLPRGLVESKRRRGHRVLDLNKLGRVIAEAKVVEGRPYEGRPKLNRMEPLVALEALAELGPGSHRHSKIAKQIETWLGHRHHKHTLTSRLTLLKERGLVRLVGKQWAMTPAGYNYLADRSPE